MSQCKSVAAADVDVHYVASTAAAVTVVKVDLLQFGKLQHVLYDLQ